MLEGKKAVVTGAAQGIGQAIAELLAQAGADVVVADLDAERCQETVDQVKKHHRQAMAVSTNVGQWDDVKALVDQVVKEWGRIDIFVNNAGITRDGLVVRMKDEDWNAVIQVNLTGTFYCTKAALGPMSKQRYGRIINMASVVGVMGNAGQANYAASKAAVIGLTKTIAREYASRNITVNAVAPGFIDTAMTQALGQDVREMLSKQIPLGRLGEARDIAEAVKFLASDAAGYITGQVLHVNGGMHMA
ncbi:3-oxoacyl-[acyl-carrier-protein] reductase [Candidatus Nitronereus thalassa]|uniref:3-oxoacyl-[acyl-carrier-protein] reductase n=1 Tax=Candidatus Nitronereus thalassa TaxID=3020898 RepID=A0ABU3K7K4_9BACT|nr:3-oxoacyl-[acyl-carrier-protein] reductase [Candidatus Nitronereus thalassa]MDT7042328.1 3-oxoacyl-[acyl-carrier-protein] reductase [Candidatus Nitronereus thalassa]